MNFDLNLFLTILLAIIASKITAHLWGLIVNRGVTVNSHAYGGNGELKKMQGKSSS